MKISNCHKFEKWPDPERYHSSNFESLQVYRTWKLEVWRFPEVWKLGFFKVSTWTSLCVCACFMYMCVWMYTCIYICSSMYMNMSKYIIYIYICVCVFGCICIFIFVFGGLCDSSYNDSSSMIPRHWFLLHDFRVGLQRNSVWGFTFVSPTKFDCCQRASTRSCKCPNFSLIRI